MSTKQNNNTDNNVAEEKGQRGRKALTLSDVVTDRSATMFATVTSELSRIAAEVGVTVEELALSVIAAGPTALKRVHELPAVAAVADDVEKERKLAQARKVLAGLGKLNLSAEDIAAMIASDTSE